jgi:hypothetical protein
MTPPADDPLSVIPPVDQVHNRLSEIAREHLLLRRQLRLSLAAHLERERKDREPEQDGKVSA